MQMETYMRGNGKTTRHMGREAILMQMEQHTSESGKMINNMARELRHGLMVPGMRDNILMARNMEEAH